MFWTCSGVSSGSLGFGDHDRLQQLVQLVLDEVWHLAHSTLVPLDHVQVQLELPGDGGVGGLAVLAVLTGLAGRTQGQWTAHYQSICLSIRLVRLEKCPFRFLHIFHVKKKPTKLIIIKILCATVRSRFSFPGTEHQGITNQPGSDYTMINPRLGGVEHELVWKRLNEQQAKREEEWIVLK